MVGTIIDLVPKPKCVIKLIDLRFKFLINRIPDPTLSGWDIFLDLTLTKIV